MGVVLASRGYPARAESGRAISGLEAGRLPPDVFVFHAGTKASDDRIVTAGGRVLTVVGGGSSWEEAIAAAYAAAGTIHFDGVQYRRDIGRKALTLGSAV